MRTVKGGRAPPTTVSRLLGFTAILSLLVPLHVDAQQVWLGLVGGAGRSGFGGPEDGALWDETRVAPAVGMSVRYQLSAFAALRAELRYAQLGGGRYYDPGRFAPQAVNVAAVYDYLQLPIMFEVGAPLPATQIARVLIRGGPVPAVMLACGYKEAPTASGGFVELDGGVSCASRQPRGTLEAEPFAAPNRIGIGLALDALLRLALDSRLSLDVGARWHFGLRSVDAYAPDRLKHRVVSFEVGFARAF